MDETTYLEVAGQNTTSFFRMAYSLLKNRHDAEDAVQQALLNAWKSRDKARDGLERAWMTRILINECHNIQRARMKSVPVEEIPEPDTPALSPQDTDLRDAVAALPESLRTPFLLKYMEGMTAKEVASAMRLPVASVKNRLFRARKILQKMLKEEVATI